MPRFSDGWNGLNFSGGTMSGLTNEQKRRSPVVAGLLCNFVLGDTRDPAGIWVRKEVLAMPHQDQVVIVIPMALVFAELCGINKPARPEMRLN